MYIETEKKKRPEFWLEQRKWTKFLEAIETDNIAHPFFVARRDDLAIIRVRVTQINQKNAKFNIPERYKVAVNLDDSLVAVTKYDPTKKED